MKCLSTSLILHSNKLSLHIEQPGTMVGLSSVVGLRRSSKALPKAKLAPNESCSLFGGLLPVWSCIASWIPAEPLPLRSMLSTSMRFTTSSIACGWCWSTEGTQFGFPWGLSSKQPACNAGDPCLIPGSGRSPGGWHDNPLQYSCLDRAWRATVHGVAKSQKQLSDKGQHSTHRVLPYPPYSPDLLLTDYHFFKHLNNFLQGKCFPRVPWIPKWGFLCYRNKQAFISHWQKCVQCNGSYRD